MSGISFGTQGKKTIADIVDLNSATAATSKSAADASMGKAMDALNLGLSTVQKQAQQVPWLLQQGEGDTLAAMVNVATDQLAQTKALIEILSGKQKSQATDTAQPAGK